MNKILISLTKVLLVVVVITFSSYRAYGEEDDSILQQLEILQNDISIYICIINKYG